ncbi:MAG TPA: CBS domain-containing protein [Nannocystaceae bacterium]|nr:CBS domain-containing protein [Nannocystaceae bacterium]
MPTAPIALVREFMTTCPHTIEGNAMLSVAREKMIALKARHLPVVFDGRLIGILSDRDVELCESLLVDTPERSDLPTVKEAMTDMVFTCGPDAHLHAVATAMAEQRIGSAVIVDPDHPTKIVGVFTTTDALRALAKYAPQE